jgi:post-segregation antitoxin (ccd killing protein)
LELLLLADKVMCVISLDKEIKEKSRQFGLNISKISENSLRFILSKMKDYNSVLLEENRVSKENCAQEVEE